MVETGVKRPTGLNLELEKKAQDGTEFKFGALSQPGIISVPLNERRVWLPDGERQYEAEDFQSCASNSPTEDLESQFTYGYKNSLFSAANLLWLEANGYVNDKGKIEFSRRFTAILSGTTRNGNSLKAPISTIRHSGLIPQKVLPVKEGMTFDEYHRRSDITQDMVNLGKEFAQRFNIAYEQVYSEHFAEALKDHNVGVAGYAWPTPVDGVYPRVSYPFNHAFLLIEPKYEAFDTYEEKPDDWTKTLAPDYSFYNYGYRLYIASEDPDPKIQTMLDTLKKTLDMLSNWLRKVYGAIKGSSDKLLMP